MKAGTTSGAMVVLVVVLVARRAHNPKVAGSNPAPASKEKPRHCKQLAGFRWSGRWDARGRRSHTVPTDQITAKQELSSP